MRYNTLSLLLICTVFAAYFAFHRSNVILALFGISTLAAVRSLWFLFRSDDTNFLRYVATGAIASLTGMLVFGHATAAVYWARATVFDSLTETTPDFATYIEFAFLFSIVYGFAAAAFGSIIGLIAYIGVALFLPPNAQSG